MCRPKRSRSGRSGLKIIAVSASVFESDRQRALDAGCDDFLSKPFAEETLHAALGRAPGLDWITAPVSSVPPGSAAAGSRREARAPPAGELEALLELSRRGDVLKIRRRLADLLAADPRHAAPRARRRCFTGSPTARPAPEIAIILDSALNTVKKHVQNILLKLGVESRLAAALRAVEILGLPGVDAMCLRAD